MRRLGSAAPRRVRNVRCTPPGAQVPLASEGVSITELDLPPEVRGQASLLALVFGIAMQCSPSRNFSRRQA